MRYHDGIYKIRLSIAPSVIPFRQPFLSVGKISTGGKIKKNDLTAALAILLVLRRETEFVSAERQQTIRCSCRCHSYRDKYSPPIESLPSRPERCVIQGVGGVTHDDPNEAIASWAPLVASSLAARPAL